MSKLMDVNAVLDRLLKVLPDNTEEHHALKFVMRVMAERMMLEEAIRGHSCDYKVGHPNVKVPCALCEYEKEMAR